LSKTRKRYRTMSSATKEKKAAKAAGEPQKRTVKGNLTSTQFHDFARLTASCSGTKMHAEMQEVVRREATYSSLPGGVSITLGDLELPSGQGAPVWRSLFEGIIHLAAAGPSRILRDLGLRLCQVTLAMRGTNVRTIHGIDIVALECAMAMLSGTLDGDLT